MRERYSSNQPNTRTRAGAGRATSRVVRGLVIGAAVMAVASCSADVSGGWTPEPQDVSSKQLAQLLESCPELQSEDRGEITAEQRGDRALLLHGTSESFRYCIVDGVGTSDVHGKGGGSGRRFSRIGDKGVAILERHLSRTDRSVGRFVLMGTVTDEVAGVEIDVGDALPDRLESSTDTVTATVEDGHFLAWWPHDMPPAGDVDPDLSVNIEYTNGDRVEGLEPWELAAEI